MRECPKFCGLLGLLVLLVVLYITPLQTVLFAFSTFLFSVIDILILPYRRSCDTLHYFTYNTSFSLEFAMSTIRFPLEQAPTSNSLGCMERSLPLPPLPSAEPSPPPWARSGSPSPVPEGQSEPASPAKKKIRIKLIVKKRPRIKLIIKKRPRIKIIVKKRPVEVPPVEKPLVEEPLAETSGNKPPRKTKLKLNPTR